MAMRYEELSKRFGGNASAIARHFKVTPGAVAHWKRLGTVPPRRIAELELERLRKGAQ